MLHSYRQHRCFDGKFLIAGEYMETVLEEYKCGNCGKLKIVPENDGVPSSQDECQDEDIRTHRKKEMEKKDRYQVEAKPDKKVIPIRREESDEDRHYQRKSHFTDRSKRSG